MKAIGLTVLVLAIQGVSFAQKGDIQITKDARLNALVAKQSEIIPPDINPKINGFRIQLVFDSDKGVINDSRARFITQFPRVDTYVEYNAPNYYLKAGDFRTRLEAEKVQSAIEMQFPTSFVIEEKINLPRLRKEEEKE